MDTVSLYYFTEAAKDLNFTQTANRLFLSQQSLSNHISRLETHFSAKLFQRKPKLQLTYEGTLFLSYAKSVVAAEKEILAILKSVANEDSGQLHIGITTPRAIRFIPTVFSDFISTFPKVHVRLIDEPSYLLEKRLLNNTVDFCLGVFYFQSPDIQATHLLSDSVFLCMTDSLLRKYRPDFTEEQITQARKGVSVGLFPALPLIMPPEDVALSRVIQSCYAEADQVPNCLLTTTYPQLLENIYLRGEAAIFLTEFNLSNLLRSRPMPEGVRFHAFPVLYNGSILGRELTLAVNRSRYLSKPAQHFISLTEALFASIEENRALSKSPGVPHVQP